MKRSRRKKSKAELEAEALFRETVARACGYRCLFHSSSCDGPLDPHHIIRRSWLKTNYSTLPDDEKWPRVHDPSNGVLLCRHHHDRVTTRHRVLWRHEIPEYTERWARDEGIEYRLEIECPFLLAESDR